ncbi:LLM class flavin-dependent oxidoreductase [Nonomuraea sp. NPDC049709]|uniref:LLM class flavin-dependent oxidoreductase n=1 Tax=Nonomuraea sp. NPDC049709 TaxID=3154736 RepID=UPI0034415C22
MEYRTAADPFVLLGVAAAATERVSVFSHALIAPIYAPVPLARGLTTIGPVSGGRLIAGFGALSNVWESEPTAGCRRAWCWA